MPKRAPASVLAPVLAVIMGFSLPVIAVADTPAAPAAAEKAAPAPKDIAAKPAAQPPAATPAPATADKKTDPQKANDKAATDVDPDTLRAEAFARGKRAYDRGDWLKAIFDLRPLSEWGDVRAMILLGNMYASGNGVGKDQKEAFELYHRAALSANSNNPNMINPAMLDASLDGMMAVAAMYQTGMGVGINTRLAIGWFERAALLGNQAGAFFYGIHKFQGSKGTTYDYKADHDEAYKWFRIAATKGTDKKLRHAAYDTSEKLAARMTPDKVIEMNKAAADWAPSTLADIGPNPEDVLIKELQAKGQNIKADDKMPEEKPIVAPKPKKPVDDGDSLVPP